LSNLHKIDCSFNLITDIPQIPITLIAYSNASLLISDPCEYFTIDDNDNITFITNDKKHKEKIINFDNNPFVDIYKNHFDVQGYYSNNTDYYIRMNNLTNTNPNVNKNKFIKFIQNLFKSH